MATDDRFSGVDAVLAELYDTGRAAGPDGTIHDLFPVSIPKQEGRALRDWVVREEAAAPIEIGLAHGVSALFICQGLLRTGHGDSRHVALDPNQATRFGNLGLQLLARAGVASMLEHIAEDSQIALPRLLADGRRFDFAFVDGNHRFDGVFVDLVYLGRLLADGSVIVLDDYQLPGVARAVSYFVRNLEWTFEESAAADDHHRWAVLRTRSQPKDRAFDFFVDF